MGKFIDFSIPYNDDPRVMGKQVMQHITVNRLKAKKPCIIFISGDSGEGKSSLGLKILDAVNDSYGVDTFDTLHDCIVYLPVQYLTKFDNILHWKKYNRTDLKDAHVLIVDEAREVVNAKDWHTFINRAVASCTNMSRRIKPMVYILISQFITDIDSDMRHTLSFYSECQRPLTGRTRVTFERVWKNTYDLQRPRLCKRPLVGWVVDGDSRSKFYPKFEATMPDKKIFNKYDEESYRAKSKILRQRIEETIRKMEKQVNIYDKVEALVDFYVKNPDQLSTIIDPRYQKFRLRKQFKDMHEVTRTEQIEFEKRLQERLQERGICAK
jgi:ABC-type oligopeptide transport system ATPase subunit